MRPITRLIRETQATLSAESRKPPWRTIGLLAGAGLVVFAAGLVVAVELAVLGVVLILAAPLPPLPPLPLLAAGGAEPKRRYDATGDDLASMLDRVGAQPRPRRPRDPNR